MAWLRRGNKWYFYRTVQKNGRATASYVGRGDAAQQAAAEIEARKQARQEQHDLQARQQAATQPLLELAQLTELLLASTLVTEGFHYYQRHWRKKRVYQHSRDPESLPAGAEADPGTRSDGRPNGSAPAQGGV